MRFGLVKRVGCRARGGLGPEKAVDRALARGAATLSRFPSSPLSSVAPTPRRTL
jgi:hypothetical protein